MRESATNTDYEDHLGDAHRVTHVATNSIPHLLDGIFSGFNVGIPSQRRLLQSGTAQNGTDMWAAGHEWSDITPAVGRLSYAYFDYNGSHLHILNDWIYNDERHPEYDTECYSLFNAWTANGTERWALQLWPNGTTHVTLNDVLIQAWNATSDVNGSLTGIGSMGVSPMQPTVNHSIFEVAFPAGPGEFGIQFHETSPRYGCGMLETEPVVFHGLIDGCRCQLTYQTTTETSFLTPSGFDTSRVLEGYQQRTGLSFANAAVQPGLDNNSRAEMQGYLEALFAPIEITGHDFVPYAYSGSCEHCQCRQCGEIAVYITVNPDGRNELQTDPGINSGTSDATLTSNGATRSTEVRNGALPESSAYSLHLDGAQHAAISTGSPTSTFTLSMWLCLGCAAHASPPPPTAPPPTAPNGASNATDAANASSATSATSIVSATSTANSTNSTTSSTVNDSDLSVSTVYVLADFRGSSNSFSGGAGIWEIVTTVNATANLTVVNIQVNDTLVEHFFVPPSALTNNEWSHWYEINAIRMSSTASECMPMCHF